MKHYFVTGFLLMFIWSAAHTQDTGSYLSLQESIETAINNSIEVQQRSLVQESAHITYKQAKSNLLPTFNGYVNHGINQGRSIDPFTNSYANQNINYATYSIASEVTLFNGLTFKNEIRQNALIHEATKMELQQAKENLTLNVILAYLQVLNNEELTELAKKQTEVTQKQVERLEILNKEGAIAPTQLYDLRALLKDGELSVVTGKNAVLTSKLLLSQLMNIPFDENLKLEKIAPQELTLFAVSVSEVYNKASGQLGLIKAAELRKQSAEAALKVAKGGHYPSLFLSSNYNSNFSSAATRDILSNATETPTSLYVIVNGNPVPVLTKQYASEKISYNNQLKNNVFSTVNLGLRIPIFNSFQTRNRVNLARIDIKNNELLTENTRRLLRQEVEQAYLNMTNSWERNRILQQQAEAYAESFRAAEVRLNAGVGNTVDYLLAKSNLDRASTNLVISKYDYLLRKKVIEYYSFKTFN